MGHATALRIGVFDSGFGGLTVLRELLPLISGAHYVYLGDTARLPYGAKSRQTVARYAVSSAEFLRQQGVDLLVIACNTATALALEDVRSAIDIPVVGVIEPGARALAEAAGSAKDVLVLATSATIQSHAYRDAGSALGLHATEFACPLLVPLVEEGWVEHPVTRDVLRIYLREALQTCTPAAILLGCTHYPLLKHEITATLRQLGSDASVIDSAQATARAALAQLGSHQRQDNESAATFQCFATDGTEKFQRLGGHFLGQTIHHVELIDLGG